MTYYANLAHFVLLNGLQVPDTEYLCLNRGGSVDLRFSQLLKRFRISSAVDFELVSNYFPTSLVAFDASGSGLHSIDFSSGAGLRQIDISFNKDIDIARGYVPASCERLNVAGTTCSLDLRGTKLCILNISGAKVHLEAGFVPETLERFFAARSSVSHADLSNIKHIDMLDVSYSDAAEFDALPSVIGTLVLRGRKRLLNLRKTTEIGIIVNDCNKIPAVDNYLPPTDSIQRVSPQNCSETTRHSSKISKQTIQRYRLLWNIVYTPQSIWRCVNHLRSQAERVYMLQFELDTLTH